MNHYVVTTSAHRDPWRGDSLDDHFCTRGVAELRFETCVQAGHDEVRLIRWCNGEPTVLARHLAAQPEPQPAPRRHAMPGRVVAVLRPFAARYAAMKYA